MFDFDVVETSSAGLTIKHINEGHEYSFYVVENDGGGIRALRLHQVKEGSGNHGAGYFSDKAFEFAAREAKRLRLV